MAVHVPLTEEAKREAAEIMLSTHNLIKPATGEPVAKPDQDVVWGCYYLTFISPENAEKGKDGASIGPDSPVMREDLNL